MGVGFVVCFLFGVPAAAQVRRPLKTSAGLIGFYTRFVQSMNPRLAFAQCRIYARDIVGNAERFRLDPALVAAVVTVESHWEPTARSWRGAQGLGQLMPSTARALGVNPYSGRENLLGTSIYLHELLSEFRGTREPLRYAVAGYNAGPGAVKQYGGIPPIPETQNYVVSVMRVMREVQAQSAGFEVAEIPSRAQPVKVSKHVVESERIAMVARRIPRHAPSVVLHARRASIGGKHSVATPTHLHIIQDEDDQSAIAYYTQIR